MPAQVNTWACLKGGACIADKPAPTGFVVPCWLKCGSEPARDNITAIYLANLGACIAGKPAPTGFVVHAGSNVGASLLAITSLRFTWRIAAFASQASLLSQGFVVHAGSNVGASLLAITSLRFTWRIAAFASQASLLSQGFVVHAGSNVGAGLPAMVNTRVCLKGRVVCFASRLAPTMNPRKTKNPVTRTGFSLQPVGQRLNQNVTPWLRR